MPVTTFSRGRLPWRIAHSPGAPVRRTSGRNHPQTGAAKTPTWKDDSGLCRLVLRVVGIVAAVVAARIVVVGLSLIGLIVSVAEQAGTTGIAVIGRPATAADVAEAGVAGEFIIAAAVIAVWRRTATHAFIIPEGLM